MSATAAVRERLSRWDTLAPLSERQKEYFLELSSTAASRPLPEHVNWQLRRLSDGFITALFYISASCGGYGVCRRVRLATQPTGQHTDFSAGHIVELHFSLRIVV